MLCLIFIIIYGIVSYFVNVFRLFLEPPVPIQKTELKVVNRGDDTCKRSHGRIRPWVLIVGKEPQYISCYRYQVSYTEAQIASF